MGCKMKLPPRPRKERRQREGWERQNDLEWREWYEEKTHSVRNNWDDLNREEENADDRWVEKKSDAANDSVVGMNEGRS